MLSRSNARLLMRGSRSMAVTIPNGASTQRSFSAPPTDRPASAVTQIYQPQRREDELPTPLNTILIYTDGSCVAGERSGAGAYFGPQHPLNIAASLPTPHNSGLAEIWAAILALEALHKWKAYRGEAIMIRTDCMVVIDGLRNGHNGILAFALTRLRLVAQRFPHGVTFQHVYGHNGHPGNDQADELARMACFGNRARSISPVAQVQEIVRVHVKAVECPMQLTTSNIKTWRSIGDSRPSYSKHRIMIIKEYRIPMPMTLDEYQRGQLFSVAEASKNETGGGEGVEVVKQEPFESNTLRPDETLEGTYTYKIYHLRSKIPWFYRKLLPETAMVLHEESWNAFPYSKTVLTNPGYMKDAFYVIVESMHIADDLGEEENALDLDDDLLDKREVVKLDILDTSELNSADMSGDTDPAKVASEKAERGPLTAGWAESGEMPVMCCYKVVQAHFKMFGVQGRAEKTIHRNYPRLFIKFHREIYCWMDRWYSLSMEEIREHEEKTARLLRQQRSRGQIRGMTANDHH
ncbi:hypothetical protein M3Y98_00981100 [Aphelenchoides besseyi]|nr:hypothetical protein M3Y98_00981100 [Aphelenchoides besseyi]